LHSGGINLGEDVLEALIAFSRSALRRARWTTFTSVPPLRKTRCAVSCSSASTSSISFFP
jgi:hypothetical protein